MKVLNEDRVIVLLDFKNNSFETHKVARETVNWNVDV
jgi:hypothetical protein